MELKCQRPVGELINYIACFLLSDRISFSRPYLIILFSDHEALFIEGKFYIVGGTNLIDAVTPTLSSLDIYDPSTDTWTSGPPMPTARY
jgi:hypothetical protein